MRAVSRRIRQQGTSQSRRRSAAPPTSLPIGESPSEGAPNADISVLEVLQSQVPHRNGLAIHLEAASLVPGHGSGQNQELREEEHMQPLSGETEKQSGLKQHQRRPPSGGWRLGSVEGLTEPLLLRSSP